MFTNWIINVSLAFQTVIFCNCHNLMCKIKINSNWCAVMVEYSDGNTREFSFVECFLTQERIFIQALKRDMFFRELKRHMKQNLILDKIDVLFSSEYKNLLHRIINLSRFTRQTKIFISVCTSMCRKRGTFANTKFDVIIHKYCSFSHSGNENVRYV